MAYSFISPNHLVRHQGFGTPEWQEFNIRRNIYESQNGGIQTARKGRADDVGNALRMGLETTSGFEASLAASLSETGVHGSEVCVPAARKCEFSREINSLTYLRMAREVQHGSHLDGGMHWLIHQQLRNRTFQFHVMQFQCVYGSSAIPCRL
jgi:hypothetical protein